MEEILVITNSDIGKNAGDTTLILRRAESLYKYGYHTTILLYNSVPQGEENTGDVFYSIMKCSGKNELWNVIASISPKYIVLCGNRIQLLTTRISRLVSKKRIPSKIILDIQGAIEEAIEYSNSFIQTKIKYPIISWSFSRALNVADGAFVVSNELIDNCEKRRKKNNRPFDYIKVRCGISEVYKEQDVIDIREKIRNQLQLNQEMIVFAYSGYRMPWQKIDEIIKQFMLFDNYLDNAHFMFFCNTDAEFEKKLDDSFPKGNYTIRLLQKHEYNKMLMACDVGYIIRDYNETNRVAFPNKFSDYVSAGLLVGINDALPEPLRVLKENDIPYIDSEKMSINDAIKMIRYRQNDYSGYLKKVLATSEKELLYSAQIEKYIHSNQL